MSAYKYRDQFKQDVIRIADETAAVYRQVVPEATRKKRRWYEARAAKMDIPQHLKQSVKSSVVNTNGMPFKVEWRMNFYAHALDQGHYGVHGHKGYYTTAKAKRFLLKSLKWALEQMTTVSLDRYTNDGTETVIFALQKRKKA